jgi:hypothetical protein
MAYASTVTAARYQVEGRYHWLVTVTETGVVDANSSWTLNLATYKIPQFGRVTNHQCVLTTGGTATTVDPRLGSVAGGTDLLDNGTAAVSTYQDCNARYLLSGQVLYGSSRANGTTTSGQIVTTFVLLEGHQT